MYSYLNGDQYNTWNSDIIAKDQTSGRGEKAAEKHITSKLSWIIFTFFCTFKYYSTRHSSIIVSTIIVL